MATLTSTTHLSTFSFPEPAASSLTFNGNPSEGDMTIPIGSNWTAGRNWHNHHVEHWKVLSGALLVSINNNSFIVTGGSPPLTIPPKTRHDLMRWDCPGRTGHQKAAQEAFRKEMSDKGQSKELERLGAQEVKAEESTTPADGEKEIFFRNLLSTVSEPRTGIWGEVLRFLHIVLIYEGLDAKMVIIDMQPESGDGWRAMVEVMIWWVLVSVARLVGAVFGLKPVSEAYTPSPLISLWEERKSK